MFDKLKISDTPSKTIALLLALTTALGPIAMPASAASKPTSKPTSTVPTTATPIQHLVVIFQENVSFDHYFGTYPNATNPAGEPKFKPAPDTPAVNGLSDGLLSNNPNLNPANGAGASNPFRLDRSQAVTADQNHDYSAEQRAFDAGLMDLFPLYTSSGGNEVMGVRRLRRMVRPPDGADHEPVHGYRGCAHGSERVWHSGHVAAWSESYKCPRLGSLRIRSQTAASGYLTVGAAEFRGPLGDRPDFLHPLH